jgi:uncharacterized iron-regulated membrane protein
MSEIPTSHKKSARFLRFFRRIHRQIAIILFVFFLIISLSGLLLGWKKNSFGLILPESSKGKSTDITTWLPWDSLEAAAINALHDSVSPSLSTKLERIDARPQKGMVKFVFDDDYWEVQVDGMTGKVLQIEQRRSDIIENIHDGTILDVLFNTKNDQFKLSYTSIMGCALLMLIITGGWLWYGPKKIRREKHSGIHPK